MNRGGSLLKNIIHMVSKFSFKISTEAAVQLTHELVTKDQLTSFTAEVQSLFKAVSERVSDPQAFAAKILSFLLGEYDKVKATTSVTSADKLKLLTLACTLANSMHAAESEKVANTTIDMILGSKDPLEVSPDVHALIKRMGAKAIEQLNTNAQKVQFASQAHLFIEAQAFDSAATIMGKLGSMNFEILANIPSLLSMARYVCDAGLS